MYIFLRYDLYFMFMGKSRSMLTADFRLRCDKFNRDANIYIPRMFPSAE